MAKIVEVPDDCFEFFSELGVELGIETKDVILGALRYFKDSRSKTPDEIRDTSLALNAQLNDRTVSEEIERALASYAIFNQAQTDMLAHFDNPNEVQMAVLVEATDGQQNITFVYDEKIEGMRPLDPEAT